MRSASVNSLDGSSFGLSCWIDSTATAARPSDSAAVEYQNLQPHKLMMLFVYDSIPPVGEGKGSLKGFCVTKAIKSSPRT